MRYFLLLLLLVSCQSHFDSVEQTDKKFVGYWQLLDKSSDDYIYRVYKQGNEYRFNYINDLGFSYLYDNTLRTTVDENGFMLKYDENSNHLIHVDIDSKVKPEEFIKITDDEYRRSPYYKEGY